MPGPFSIETLAGQPLTIHQHRLLPFHQVLRINLPFKRGGLVWNRPVAFLVTAPDQSEQVLRVPDPTGKTMWAIFGVVAAALLLSKVFKR